MSFKPIAPLQQTWWQRIEPWWMVGVLLMFYVISILDRLVINMLVIPIQKDLGLSDFEISLLMGPAFAICFGLCGYPLGWMTDRFSRRGVIFGGIVFWSAATVMTGLAKSFPVLFAARMGVGAGEAGLQPAAYSLIADKFPKERMTTALSIFGMGPKVGTAFAFAVGGWVIAYSAAHEGLVLPLVGEVNSWRLAMLLIGAPGILLALLAFTFKEPARKNHVKPAAGNVNVFTYMGQNKPLFISLLLGFAFSAVAAASLVSWVPTYITREFGWSPKEYAPVMTIVNVISASSILFKGVIIDWLYKRGIRDAHVRFYTWLLAVTPPLAIAAFCMTNPYWFMAMYAVVDVVLVSFLLYIAATVQLLVPNNMRGQTTAIFMLVTATIAAGIAPTIVASLTDFVFADQQQLGKSLMIVTTTASIIAFVVLRYSLRHLRPALEQQERDNDAFTQQQAEAKPA
ncbi:spinster family MFS transporter [Pseudomonas sp. 5P_3.1_Bac2]|uniref:spinster family MFS transporter n=1 Tax=Pseudomonas sp. 5P_3.1_Bac2 TaxID=2971617 RepID=UPI0021C81633|nr:MFS transporter [Pseudomonas sp. 5P_3.1_Bac2]MCU1719512.1 MFS transporter [Pseudomonas sp. 5P_3.1_Bac2]